jgi:hypothetical protein
MYGDSRIQIDNGHRQLDISQEVWINGDFGALREMVKKIDWSLEDIENLQRGVSFWLAALICEEYRLLVLESKGEQDG